MSKVVAPEVELIRNASNVMWPIRLFTDPMCVLNFYKGVDLLAEKR